MSFSDEAILMVPHRKNKTYKLLHLVYNSLTITVGYLYQFSGDDTIAMVLLITANQYNKRYHTVDYIMKRDRTWFDLSCISQFEHNINDFI